ncbi:hypothetical protein THRCLA_06435 [Thraustotheca clavata]|uniref:Uncharacterized protein n=1 Tax=Thraustotheca clavata TaxID=74557 RepID=A0A1V9ZNQ5_9STRA|nr:hypothetical protein THRCLA_06435 [Thraustotheca clavata]
MCTDATQGCSSGTVCQPLVTNATLPLDMVNLTNAPTTIPPTATKNTFLYALLCGGLICLVLILYGVLRWIQKQKKRDAKLDSECTAVTSEVNGYHASTDAGNESDKIASLHGKPTEKSIVEPQWKYGVHDDPATYSMFHTVGRISNGKHGASNHFSFSQRKEDSIIYIMEDEDPKLRPSED